MVVVVVVAAAATVVGVTIGADACGALTVLAVPVVPRDVATVTGPDGAVVVVVGAEEGRGRVLVPPGQRRGDCP